MHCPGQKRSWAPVTYQHIVEVLSGWRLASGQPGGASRGPPSWADEHPAPRYRNHPEAVAYLTVAEGCRLPLRLLHIPKLRGDQRSRPIAVDRGRKPPTSWAAQGVQELILISQITTNYGLTS